MKKQKTKIILLIIAGILLFPFIAFGEVDIHYTDDGFKIKTNDQWIKIGGTLMWDVDSADSAFWETENNDDAWQTRSELRRARLNIKTKIKDNWKIKLQLDFAGDDGSVELKDAYVEYGGWEMMNLIIGQDKEAFGLENLSSSKNLPFIERSMVSSAFAPGRNLGISLNRDTEKLIWQAGVYQAQTRKNDGDTYAITGRIAYAPWKTDSRFFHLGVSGAYRDYAGEEFEIRESAQIHTAENIIFSDAIDCDDLLSGGIETAFGAGPFSFGAEYMIADVKAVDRNDDAIFDGYYLSAGWFLTGETRPFKNGTWGRVKPESTYGAWELVSRYACLDTADHHIGIESETYTLGVNWYINSNISLMSNYTHLCANDEETDEKISGDALAFRLQCLF